MDRCHLRSNARLVGGALIWMGMVAPLSAQLPSESALPGQQRTARSLPDESALPDRGRRRLPENIGLPAENRIPPSIAGRHKSAVTTYSLDDLATRPNAHSLTTDLLAQIVRPDRSPDGTPWLQLHLKGHVGRIRGLAFSGDSRRLCSAGDDKRVFVWGPTTDAKSKPAAWSYQRSIHWQIQRGSRGRIYTLATSDDLLAIAGHGATGGLGEILLVDARTGDFQVALVDQQIGHRQVVVSLHFSPDPEHPGLASVDREGRALYWQPDRTGQWRARVIQPADREHYGAELAGRLYPFRESAQVLMLDAEHLVLPVFFSQPDRPTAVAWQLRQFDVETGDSQPLLEGADGLHRGMVTALACSRDGSRLASADLARFAGPNAFRFFLWDLERRQQVTQRTDRLPLSLAFSENGQTLLVGTSRTAEKSAVVQNWNTSDSGALEKRQPDVPVSSDVYACAISPDGNHLAYTSGAEVVVQPAAHPGDRHRLRAPISAPLRVACARRGPGYQVAIGNRKEGGQIPLARIFDASAPQLNSPPQVDEKDWTQPQEHRGRWRLVRDDAQSPPRILLTANGRTAGQIPFDLNLHGNPSAWCWIPDADGNPRAVAIGAQKNNNVYVFGLTREGICPILRVFRGHGSEVTSLAVTHDRRYLVSGGLDTTIRFWPLAQLRDEDRLIDRWGAQFAVGNDDALEVISVRKDGPLYFRGVRQGDTLKALTWYDLRAAVNKNKPVVTRKTAKRILQRLRQSPWDTLSIFHFMRGRAPRPLFQMFPAWQPLVSLVVSENREWAFWTPAGYYDASFEGHRLFGWQVNRGLNAPPDVFLADQMRKALERPDAMSRLLETGNLDDALLQIDAKLPTEAQRAVEEAYALKPTVRISEPAEHSRTDAATVRLKATITIRNGQRLVPPKAFANGVLATHRRQVNRQSIIGGYKLDYEWEAHLPSQRRIRLQVVAATEGEVVGRSAITIRRTTIGWRRSRLFIATAGINHYRDAQLPRLEFAVNNAIQVAKVFQQGSQPLYRTYGLALSDQLVTRPVWSDAMKQYAARLRQHATPDDLLVIFLSGHGVRDRDSDTYYYVTANARFRDIAARRYRDCFSFDDFTLFSDVPCRKLVILDTCHSGALQPLRQRELKSALRALQDDLVFTLTASEGKQEAVEERKQQLGRFTNRLLEALRGAADTAPGNRDGVVSWGEIVQYVKTTVRADSIGDTYQQFPTAGPSDLIEFANFPVTAVTGDRGNR